MTENDERSSQPNKINHLPTTYARTEGPEVSSKASETSLIFTRYGTFAAQLAWGEPMSG
jgi:hypothetical protein